MRKSTTYTVGIESNVEHLMPKRRNEELSGFGARLALYRKAAGYTQQELADELGVSRRMIAYYEGETQHPPTTILPKMAIALGVTTDVLLNVNGGRTLKPQQMSTRFQRKLLQIEKLGSKERRQAMQLLDMILEREQLRKHG